jgi:hypothetical protein
MSSIHGAPDLEAVSQTPNVMTDPLMQPIIQGVDITGNNLVSGVNGAVNLGVGTAALVALGGVAVGGAVVGGMMARSPAPYDNNYISPAQEPSLVPAQESRVSRQEETFSPAMAVDPVIASMGLPQRALEALAQISQQHGRALAGIEVSNEHLGKVVATAQRDAGAERAVAPTDLGLVT